MSASGSYYGWVFPSTRTEEEILDYLSDTLRNFGMKVERRSPSSVHCVSASGRERSFRLLSASSPQTVDCKVIYTISSNTWFRPMELNYNSGGYPNTLADYDLAKQVFNLSDAVECFGFCASQMTGSVFQNSILEFFFLKEGPQLILANLDERRMPRREEEIEVDSRDEEYFPWGAWDDLLHSRFFARFSQRDRYQIRSYSLANKLIERPWRDYYHPGPEGHEPEEFD